MVAKLCPIMSSANYKVDCDVHCAFCVNVNGVITCSINAILQNSEEIKKKLDSIIFEQKKVH